MLRKVFIQTNTWKVGNNLMKHYYLKHDFNSNLNMEDIKDADYEHAKKIWKNFEI